MTTDEIFARAIKHHQAGRLAEAEAACRDVLARRQNHADALYMLGLIAQQTSRSQVALDFIREAIAANPRVADYHISMGVVLTSLNRREEAADAYQQALEIRPDHLDAMYYLGAVLIQLRRADEAASSFRKVLAANPNHVWAQHALGNAERMQGHFEEAVVSYRKAVKLKPDFVAAYLSVAAALGQMGRFEESIAAYRLAVAANPNSAEAHSHLSHALGELGHPAEAEAEARRALALRPDMAEFHSNLAIILAQTGRVGEALQECQTAVTLKPTDAAAQNNLGNILNWLDRSEEAVDAYRAAIAVNPKYAEAWNNLGNALRVMARLDDALEAYRKAMQLCPHDSLMHSNVIFTMNFHPAFDAAAIFREVRQWNERYAKPLAKLIQPHAHNRDGDRRLKIGYVSPDFRAHVVGWNLLPLLRQHDHKQFEIFCYASVKNPDSMTEQIRAGADQWRDMIGVSDQAVADQISRDGIDILIDLSLHTANNRLRTFAMEPAPVQITYLGYCGTSGLDAMHYRFSDPHLDPPDTDLSLYSEETIRLPETYWCYAPGGEAPDVSPPPVLRNGFVTFGCMNQFSKVSPATVELWCEILAKSPNSRFLIHAPNGKHLETIGSRLSSHGIELDRVEFIGTQSWSDYLATYHRIDIALDPFPYNGGITTCDTLWMGVPVVTLSGRTPVGRGGRSILSNVGLPQLIAHDPQEYMRLAIELAGDVARLGEMRRSMRNRLAASPLMNAPRFARNVESAYRGAWRRWCG